MHACLCGERFETEHGRDVHIGLARREEGRYVLYVDPDSGRQRLLTRRFAEDAHIGDVGRACALHGPMLAVVAV